MLRFYFVDLCQATVLVSSLLLTLDSIVVAKVVYLTGWAPDASQRGPAKRGSATVSFEDLHKELSRDV